MLRSTLLLTLLAAAVLAGCGGKSSSTKLKDAAALLRSQTISGAPGAEKPSSVKCRESSDGPDCRVSYPDGQVQDCAVSISSDSRSVSCNLTKATIDAANVARRFVGTWNTTFGQMQLKTRTGHVGQLIGVYAQCNGRIDAAVTGGKLTGRWHESGPAGNCASASGRFSWTLKPDASRFDGFWTRSDGTTGGDWQGVRVSG